MAVLVAAATLWSLGGGPAVEIGLAIALGGLVVAATGAAVTRRGHPLVGWTLTLAGGGACLAAVVVAASMGGRPSTTLRVVPGVIGVPVLGLALVPIRGSGSRTFVGVGAGCVFLSVLLAGLFNAVGLGSLLIATVGVLLAWDVGVHAIEVGQQLGRQAATWRIEASHATATAVVGGAGIALVHLASGVAAGGASLASFALTVVALVFLTAALRR